MKQAAAYLYLDKLVSLGLTLCRWPAGSLPLTSKLVWR